ncbi:MAG TPA: cell wall-binding repeat-containing protein, partial [Egibacteraceae bacterium]|nr:cell wall-binding repeat-containing protein [Egibacteraceae bacterium]
ADTVVLGGQAAVSDGVVAALPRPRRVAGGDRAATAAAVAAQLWGRTVGADGDAFVLSGGYRPDAWALALAAAPLAARSVAPLLLADVETLPTATHDYLDDLGYGDGRTGSGWVLGDRNAVSDAVAEHAAELLQ